MIRHEREPDNEQSLTMARVALEEIAREHGLTLEDVQSRRRLGMNSQKTAVRRDFLRRVARPLGLNTLETASVLGVTHSTVTYHRKFL